MEGLIEIKRKIMTVLVALASVCALGAAKGCPAATQTGSGTTATSSAPTPSPKYTVPKGAVAQPPANGGGVDPHDPDFHKPAPVPAGAPSGTVTYEVRAQMYYQGDPIGGLATAFINATALNPNALGGVGGAHPGVFPYNRESVRLPFQFPIYIQPGISVSVGATFNAFADEDESLRCWFVDANGLDILGTKASTQATARHSLISVSCYGNIG